MKLPSIREHLRQHLRGLGGPCTRAATEFDYETSSDPVALYRHYVAVYVTPRAACCRNATSRAVAEASAPRLSTI
jgi:hypothetical protein